MKNKTKSWHIAVAGCDVSVQYGADQPEYDLIVAKGDRMLKVSVKGSQDEPARFSLALPGSHCTRGGETRRGCQ
jgi:hypothetical protein